MKKTIPLIIITSVVLLINLLSCGNRANPLLDSAEDMVEEQPDYAILLLNTMEKRSLSQSENARWCLIYTQACDKIDSKHSSDSIIRIAVSYYERHNNPDMLMRSYYYMGRVSQVMQNAPMAQEYYLKALNIGESIKDTVMLSFISSQLGMLYTYQYAYGEALLQMNKTLTYLKSAMDTVAQSYTLRNIARTYGLADSIDKSIFYYRQALEYSVQRNRPSILQELGDRLVEKKDYKAAYPYLLESIHLADEEDYPLSCLVLGRLFVETEKTDSARYYLMQSLKTTKQQTILGAYAFLAKLSKKNHNYEDYADYQTRYETLRDSVEANIHIHAMLQMRSLYDYRQVQNMADIAEIKKKTAQRNGLAAIIFALLTSGFSATYITYTASMQKRVDREKEEVLQRFQELDFKETNDHMERNIKMIGQLKKDIMNKERTKKALLYEIRLLEIENSWIHRKTSERERIEKEFIESKMYLLLQNEKNADKISREELENVINSVDRISPTFKHRIAISFKEMTYEDIHILYLLKANVKKTQIAGILHLSRQAINNRCKRMVEEAFGKESSQSILDQFIGLL